MSTSRVGAAGIVGAARTAALDSGGGHGYIKGGSVGGGQVLDDWAVAPGARAWPAGGDTNGVASGGGVGYGEASSGAAGARQRTKKLPALPLNTGCSS